MNTAVPGRFRSAESRWMLELLQQIISFFRCYIHAAGDPLALGQLGEIVRLGDAELLEGLGGVRDVLPGAAVGEDGRFLKAKAITDPKGTTIRALIC